MKLPSPARLGLPAKIAKWYFHQERAILDLLDSEVRFDGINAPVGSGKTGIMLGVAQLLPDSERVLHLTSTIALQDQLVADAYDLGLRKMMGKSRYRCHAASSGGELAGMAATSSADDGYVTIEHAPCYTAQAQCSLMQSGCEWFDAIRAARSARIVSMSYAKWIATADPVKEFGKFDWLFCDEAADAERHVTDALTIELKRSAVESALGIPWPAGREPGIGATGVTTWREWAQHYRTLVDTTLRDAEGSYKAAMATGGGNVRAAIGRMMQLREVCSAMSALRQISSQWVHDDLKAYGRTTGAVFQPIWPANDTEGMLFRGVERVVLMGATLVEKHLDILGVPPEQRRFTSYPSTFPVARRPIYVCKLDPPLKLSYKAEQDERVRQRVVAVGDAITEARLDRNGIAHTVSYKRRNYILTASHHRDIIITHAADSASTKAAIARFKEMRDQPPARLDSPSVGTGYDFPLTEAEYCWIPKLPFVDRDSALMRARCAIDPKYADLITANTWEQYVGRGMRGPADSFESIVTDHQAVWFPWANRELFSPHFLAAIRVIDGLPAPMPKLSLRPRDVQPRDKGS